QGVPVRRWQLHRRQRQPGHDPRPDRSEEHTSELQSLTNLVCRLLLEKTDKTRFGSTSSLLIRPAADTSQCPPARGFPSQTLRRSGLLVAPLAPAFPGFVFFNGPVPRGILPFSPPRPLPP